MNDGFGRFKLAEGIAAVAVMLAASGFAASPACAAAHIDFGGATWTPLRSTVKIEREKPSSPNGSSGLRIRGRFEDGDASAVSDARPMEEYQVYRIRARVRAVRFEQSALAASSIMPFPYVRCEFMTDDEDGCLGMADARVAAWKWGEWNDISGEFRAPWGTRRCRVVVADDYSTWEKGRGTSGITFTVDIQVAGIVIEPVAGFCIDGRYPAPSTTVLKERRGMHPRLYFTEERIAALREAVKTTHAPLWKRLREQADAVLKNRPPEWRTSGPDVWDEQWWMSGNAASMLNLATAYVISGERRYFDGARDWALTTCAYPSWGTSWAANVDCMDGHNIFALSIVYDWLYEDLSEKDRATIRDTVVSRGGNMFLKAASGTIVPSHGDFSKRPWPEWEEAWLQNHLWVNSTGLLAAGLAFHDERSETGRWIAFARERFVESVGYLGPDGASHEGINYWSYGMEHLLKSMHLLRDFGFENLYDHPWFKGAALYRLHMSIPRGMWERGFTTVDYGDSHPRDASGPDHILRALAAEYRDPHAQRLARVLDDAGVLLPGNFWLNLIWYDPSVPEANDDDQPTFHLFDDQGFVAARTNWSGDESYLFFKCGPYIGHYALENMTYCASSAHHTHPDQNGFMLYGAGERLMRDDGNYGKYTGQHNTLLIDGGEQLGGGESIFDGSRLHALRRAPKILTAESTPSLDHIAGDAAEAYPPETGLTKYERRLLFLKEANVLIVLDDIALDKPRELELRFHPGPQEAANENDAFVTRTEKSVMRFEALTPEGVTSTAEMHPLVDRRYNTSDMLAYRLRKTGARWTNAVAISWAVAGKEPERVKLSKRGDSWVFTAGGREVTYDGASGKAFMAR